MFLIVAFESRTRVDEAREIALEKRDVRALDRDVGPRPHRDAHVRSRERRRVVHAVSRHRDDPALALEARHGLGLGRREDPRDDLVDSELRADALGGRLRVAREHHDANSQAVHLGDGGASRSP